MNEAALALVRLLWPELDSIPNEVALKNKLAETTRALQLLSAGITEQTGQSMLAVFQGIDRRFATIEKRLGIDDSANERAETKRRMKFLVWCFAHVALVWDRFTLAVHVEREAIRQRQWIRKFNKQRRNRQR